MKLLQSQKLARILKENDVKLIFYIHPKFKDYLSEFNVSGDNIELIPFGTEPLNEIMKKCSMLITDYSSVCWDVCYLDKPVLFYQLIMICICRHMEVIWIWSMNYLENVIQNMRN